MLTMWNPTPNSSAPAVRHSSAAAAGSAPANNTGRTSDGWKGCVSDMSHDRADEGERRHDVGGPDGDGGSNNDLSESLGALFRPTERPDPPADHEPEPRDDPRRRPGEIIEQRLQRAGPGHRGP